MTLAEFRATRRVLTMAQAKAEMPFLADMEYLPEYDSAYVYSAETFILNGRKGHYLQIESDEYESRDLALLEFILWLWLMDTPESQTLRGMIWA